MVTTKHKSRLSGQRRSSSAVGEECWILVGQRRGRIWLARRIGYATGTPFQVEFDGLGVLAREERRHDVIGFLHTHPHGDARPSVRDLRTMLAWCSAFGKPLLCVIATGDRMVGYRFDNDQSQPVTLAGVEQFPRGILVGVEGDGRQDAS